MRRFLFLQGPHGPFFRQLSKMLRKTGADTIRVGFNKGDEIFWGPDNFIAFTQDLTQWPDTFSNIVTKHTITDVVLYGDTRPIHKQAIEIAQARNITIHVFEEGYMRPYWITYERNGSNGNSRLMDMSLADMQQALQYSNLDTPMPPSHWGDTRQHIFYGAVYHWLVMFANRKYRHFKSHRRISVQAEFALYVKRLVMMPFHHIQRRLKTTRTAKRVYWGSTGLVRAWGAAVETQTDQAVFWSIWPSPVYPIQNHQGAKSPTYGLGKQARHSTAKRHQDRRWVYPFARLGGRIDTPPIVGL